MTEEENKPSLGLRQTSAICFKMPFDILTSGYAFYYPHLTSKVLLECEGVDIVASHDLATACDENRHMMDVDVWNQVREKNPRLVQVIQPNPPCTHVNGTRQEQEGGNVVIGE